MFCRCRRRSRIHWTGRAYSDGRPNRRWRRRHHGATERVWTRPKMQTLSWTVRRNVVRCIRVSGLSIAAFHLPRARMEMRGAGPNRLRELESSPFEYRFSRSRLVDRLPLHCPPTCLRSRRYPFACRSGGRRWLPADLPVCYQRPCDARHPVGQRHRDQHPRLARQHPGQP